MPLAMAAYLAVWKAPFFMRSRKPSISLRNSAVALSVERWAHATGSLSPTPTAIMAAISPVLSMLRPIRFGLNIATERASLRSRNSQSSRAPETGSAPEFKSLTVATCGNLTTLIGLGKVVAVCASTNLPSPRSGTYGLGSDCIRKGRLQPALPRGLSRVPAALVRQGLRQTSRCSASSR